MPIFLLLFVDAVNDAHCRYVDAVHDDQCLYVGEVHEEHPDDDSLPVHTLVQFIMNILMITLCL